MCADALNTAPEPEALEVLAALRGETTEKRRREVLKSLSRRVAFAWTLGEDELLELEPIAKEPKDAWLPAVVEASRAGLLHSFLRCHRCNRWFESSRKTQKYHSAKCQRSEWQDFRKTEEGRRLTREQVRRWRKEHEKKGGGDAQ
jgi:uncharacterized C2H2 Zn-finger protein